MAGRSNALPVSADRRAARETRSPLFTWVGVALAAYIVTMTVLTYTLPKL